MRRSRASLSLIIALLFGLTGCTPANKGLAGITVDVYGNVIGVFAWCDDNPPTVAHLDYEAGGNKKRIATYVAPELSGQTARFRLESPTDGWVAEPIAPILDADKEYHLWGGDNKSAMVPITFHLADRRRLSEEIILAQSYDETTREWVDALVSQAEFERQAQRFC